MSRPEVLPLSSPAGVRWLREALESSRAALVRALAVPPEVLKLREPGGKPSGMGPTSTDSHGAGPKGLR